MRGPSARRALRTRPRRSAARAKRSLTAGCRQPGSDLPAGSRQGHSILLLVGVGLELLFLLDDLVVLGVALAGTHRADLEPLEQLVAGRVVERHPVAVVDVVGQLRAGVRGVVDDDQDLRLGVEVGPGTGGELFEVEAAKTSHAAQSTAQGY